MGKVHIIGAGVAGLAAAVELASRSAEVVVHEAAGGAGGRCRSWHDPLLEAEIDNGNHLMLSGNWATLGYLDRIGARDRLIGPERAVFPFFDLQSGERWTVDINRGPVPWWILDKDRRVRGTSLGEYIDGLRLLNAGERTVTQIFRSQGPFFHRFWEPFTIAVLNTPPDRAAARLLLPVIRETLAQGSAKSTPLIARRSLADTLVAPALAMLQERGADMRFGAKIRGLEREGKRVTALVTARGREPVSVSDSVIAAVPAWAIGELLPEITAPSEFAPIVNLHFRIDDAPLPLMPLPLLGLLGGTAQWLFVRDNLASVTISAAMSLVEEQNTTIAERVWRDIATALDRNGSPMPKVRVVKEHRATFLASPEQNARRPKAVTPYGNLVLAGEWIDTGLPTTIEGAIRSGQAAAAMCHG
ncbi:MAG TPA: hydroxysqualene dehydroxylase HpnE [Aestuariivirgaceae bacterium]|jgi:hydroxysqualene dehydroxylase|nr:hydroxysqualene dehydroxylase HpnE [Aestuariivirgaceae bacterium]